MSSCLASILKTEIQIYEAVKEESAWHAAFCT